MTKNDLIGRVCQLTGFPRREVTSIVGATFQAIAEALTHGAIVSIAEFGKFSLRHCKPRRARNFKTGEYYTMDGYTNVKFEVADGIYDILNGKIDGVSKKSSNDYM